MRIKIVFHSYTNCFKFSQQHHLILRWEKSLCHQSSQCGLLKSIPINHLSLSQRTDWQKRSHKNFDCDCWSQYRFDEIATNIASFCLLVIGIKFDVFDPNSRGFRGRQFLTTRDKYWPLIPLKFLLILVTWWLKITTNFSDSSNS